MAFDYPASWTPSQYDVQSSFSTSIVYLSTGPLHDPCDRTPSSISCAWPVHSLEAGGVLVEWGSNAFPLWTLAAQPGTLTSIGGRPAKVRVETPGDCGQIGAQVSVVAQIAASVAANYFSMLACINGPNAAAAQRQVMSMLRTVKVIQP